MKCFAFVPMLNHPHDDPPKEQDIVAFAARLDAYAATLAAREREALMIILARAMDPGERMRWRHAATLLDPSEEAALRALLDEEL